MSLIAFIMIALSACSHASWNLLAKKSKMSLAFYTAICLVTVTLWLHTQFWTPVVIWQMPKRFWIFLAGSVLSDVIYALGLPLAYRRLDMSSAYPMMRALPLPLTALLTALFGIGNRLSLCAMCGMVIVFAGCLIIPLKKISDFKLRNYANISVLYILIAACGTTGYTIFDSLTQKEMARVTVGIARPVLSLTFYSTRGVLLLLILLTVTLLWRENREKFFGFFRERNPMPLYAGLFASATYVLVLMSMNYVTNVSYVQVFRQIGLIFGVAAGVIILKEECSAAKLLGVTLIIFGLIISVV